MATASISRLLTPPLFTAAEYALMADVSGYRDELIEGQRVLSPMPKLVHSLVLDQLTEILKNQLSALAVGAMLTIVRETGWKLSLNAEGLESVPGPDLMVVSTADLQRAVEKGSWFEGTPTLVIEVISPSERKSRRMQKVGLYLETGVPHVVEIDYTRRVVNVHHQDSERVDIYGSDDKMTSPFQTSVAAIFSSIS